MSAALRIEHLSVRMKRGRHERVLVRDVSLEIPAGQSLALVGESGCGKSMTARAVINMMPGGAVASGVVDVAGTDVLSLDRAGLQHLRARRVAMIFQDPRAHLNPVRTIGDFLTEPLTVHHRVPAEAARARAIELLELVLVDRPHVRMRQYPHQLSGGLLQRVMIAAALVGSPELILADEPTTALDVTTQAEIMATLMRLQTELGVALLFITHDLDLAAAACDRTAVMYAGGIVEEQTSANLHTHPLHPYTQGLGAARPSVDRTSVRLTTIVGQPLAPHDVEPGCSFSSRCPYSLSACTQSQPTLRPIQHGLTACLRAEDIVESLAETREVSHG